MKRILLLALCISASFLIYYKTTSLQTKAYIKCNLPANFSWIDDDFNTTNGVFNALKIADDLDIKINFAAVPDGDYKVSLFSYEKQKIIDSLLSKGHKIIMHPNHKLWYGKNKGSIEEISNDLHNSIEHYRMLDKNVFLAYPGSSLKDPRIIKLISGNCTIGFAPTGFIFSSPNNKYLRERLFINLSDNMSKQYYKDKIDEMLSKDKWVILATHSHDWTESNIIDETTMSTANLKDILTYCKTKADFVTINEYYSNNKPLLDILHVSQ